MSPTESVLRFVVLQHIGIEENHFDLMVETAPNSLLATWRSPCWPIIDTTPLIKLRDHRRIYLDYEGPIAGDRGAVHRVSDGHCQNVSNSEIWLSDAVIVQRGSEWIAMPAGEVKK